MAQVGVNIASEDLQKTARKYRKELLQMPVIALSRSLQHMSLRPGIRYSETVGELSGDMQFGPYSETRVTFPRIKSISLCGVLTSLRGKL